MNRVVMVYCNIIHKPISYYLTPTLLKSSISPTFTSCMDLSLSHTHPIVLFDGVCNLCNGVVQFIIKKDKKEQFRFASLQSDFGQQILQHFHLPQTDFNSFIYLENGKLYTKSSAALRMAKRLGGGWQILYGFMIVPPFIRNGIYNWVARNRYKWYGKQESCWLPTPDLKGRFIQ